MRSARSVGKRSVPMGGCTVAVRAFCSSIAVTRFHAC